MTLDKAAHPPTGSVISTGVGRPIPHPPTGSVISTAANQPIPHPSNEYVISTGVGRRFFPPSLPRRYRPTQWRNLSSIDRGGLCSPNATITTQLLKRRKLALCGAVNLPFFNTFQTLA